MEIIQCVGDLSGWGVFRVSEVVIKVGFVVVGWLLPLAYGNIYPIFGWLVDINENIESFQECYVEV